MINNLKDIMVRMESELRERVNEMSRVRSPPNLTLNNSFAGESLRHDEDVRLVNEQLDRKN